MRTARTVYEMLTAPIHDSLLAHVSLHVEPVAPGGTWSWSVELGCSSSSSSLPPSVQTEKCTPSPPSSAYSYRMKPPSAPSIGTGSS